MSMHVTTSGPHGLSEGDTVRVPMTIRLRWRERLRAWLADPWHWPPRTRSQPMLFRVTGVASATSYEIEERAAPFSLGAFRYFIGNPSAWDHYDDDISEEMRCAADEIERLQTGPEILKQMIAEKAVGEISRDSWQRAIDFIRGER